MKAGHLVSIESLKEEVGRVNEKGNFQSRLLTCPARKRIYKALRCEYFCFKKIGGLENDTSDRIFFLKKNV
jgi:hypothetical protein